MNADGRYAFYGSLRRGMINHKPFSKGLQYLFTETLSGYRLHAMENYPYAVRTGNPENLLVAEIYTVTDRVIELAIHELELGVGYSYAEVLVRGMATGIYLFNSSGPEPLVPGGDWVKFFGPHSTSP